VVASATIGAKESGGWGVRTNDRLTSAGSMSAQYRSILVKTCPGHEADVLDIRLVSRHSGIIDHGAIYSLLSECL
jgi:hypothetical protein